MHHDWSSIDVERKQEWATKCWLNSAHGEFFPLALSEEFGLLVDEFNQQLADTNTAYKHDRTTTVMPFTRNGNDYVLKRYNARSFWHRVKRALRSSRAQRCWCMCFHFQRAGLNVAEPIMMLEDRAGPITKNAYLVSARLKGHELLTQLPNMDEAQKAQVLLAIESAFEKMYQHRITHGDMKATNLLWVDGQLFFIDLDAAKKHRSRLTWHLSNQKDRKRFMKNWQTDPQLVALFSSLV